MKTKAKCIGYSFLYVLTVSLCPIFFMFIRDLFKLIGIFKNSLAIAIFSGTFISIITLLLYFPFKRLAGGGWLHKLSVLIFYIPFGGWLGTELLNMLYDYNILITDSHYMRSAVLILLLLFDIIASYLPEHKKRMPHSRGRLLSVNWLLLPLALVFAVTFLSLSTVLVFSNFIFRPHTLYLFSICAARALVLVAAVIGYFLLGRMVKRRFLYSVSCFAFHQIFGGNLAIVINLLGIKFNPYIIFNLFYTNVIDHAYYYDIENAILDRNLLFTILFAIDIVLLLKDRSKKRSPSELPTQPAAVLKPE